MLFVLLITRRTPGSPTPDTSVPYATPVLNRRDRKGLWLGGHRETPSGTRSSWLSPFPTRRVASHPEARPVAEQHEVAAGYSEFQALGDAPGAFDEMPGSGRRTGLAGDLFEQGPPTVQMPGLDRSAERP